MPLQLSRQNNCQIGFYSSFYYLDKSCGIYNLALKFKFYNTRQFTKQMSNRAWVGSGQLASPKRSCPSSVHQHLPAVPMSHPALLATDTGKAQIKLSSAAKLPPKPRRQK